MVNKNFILILIALIFVLAIPFFVLEVFFDDADKAEELVLSQQDLHALELGRKVLAVKAALAAHEDPNSLKAIRDLGLDSRYYVMVRGWLSMELSGAKSILDASRDNPNPQIQQKADFLKKAIRAIDLE